MNTEKYIDKLIQRLDDGNSVDFKKEIILLCENAFDEGNYLEPTQIDYNKRMVFETEIWQIGELIRKKFLKRKAAISSPLFFDTISEIIQTKKYRSGRQSFVLLFGDFKLFEKSDFLATFLSDEYVYGHVIISLLKLKNFKYCKEVKDILEQEATGWIKQKGKKYLENCT